MIVYVMARNILCQRPEDVPCQHPLLICQGRENVTYRGHPSMVTYVMPRNVLYLYPMDVSYLCPEDIPHMALYVMPWDVPYRHPKDLPIHMVLHAMLRAISYQALEEVQIAS